MGPLMVPALSCDWCGTCVVIPSARRRDVVRLDGLPDVDSALTIAESQGWRFDAAGSGRCPRDTRDHGADVSPPNPTLTSIER